MGKNVCMFSTVSFTLRFVNLFAEVSRVCAVLYFLHPCTQWCEIILEGVLLFLYHAFEFTKEWVFPRYFANKQMHMNAKLCNYT